MHSSDDFLGVNHVQRVASNLDGCSTPEPWKPHDDGLRPDWITDIDVNMKPRHCARQSGIESNAHPRVLVVLANDFRCGRGRLELDTVIDGQLCGDDRAHRVQYGKYVVTQIPCGKIDVARRAPISKCRQKHSSF